MKLQLLILLFVLGSINISRAQVIPDEENSSPQELYDFHIQKKKANNLAGWLTLTGGVAMIVGGLGINLSGGIVDNDSTNNNKGLWLSYLGGATTVASIPLFIASGKHKSKAKIQLENGAVGYTSNPYNYSAVSLVISF